MSVIFLGFISDKEMNVGVMQVGGAKKNSRAKKRSGERRGSAPKPPKIGGGGRFPDV